MPLWRYRVNVTRQLIRRMAVGTIVAVWLKGPETMLPPLVVLRRSGGERLCANGETLPFSLLDFWQWSVSDLVSNATRGRFAEFIVATALGHRCQRSKE